VQTWLNPRLSTVQPTSAELTWLQWAIRSSDFRCGNLQDEVHKLKVEPDNARREASAFENDQARLRQQLDQKISELAVELKGGERQVSALEQTVKAQKHEISGLRQQISELAVELKDGERQASALEQTVKAQKHEITGLRQQLEGWQKHWQSVENSAGWRALSVWRSIRDSLAPERTWRRRLYDSVISRLRPHALRGQL
jgi:chromosome segregation ATPase